MERPLHNALFVVPKYPFSEWHGSLARVSSAHKKGRLEEQ